ncbi:743_t:CDS:2 [Paraglomus occultum]|uniref:743_t:CDS:1 n=1 Tax=Paraglomus occultum TaxID=144539 RepID=A0A9N9CPC2_9GLOM|nr:743_t:CDS:2 [Paraglomus occultum]
MKFTRASRKEVFKVLNRYEEALVNLDWALRQDPENVFALGNRSEIYRSLKRFDEALTGLDKALETEPDNPLALKTSLVLHNKQSWQT